MTGCYLSLTAYRTLEARPRTGTLDDTAPHVDPGSPPSGYHDTSERFPTKRIDGTTAPKSPGGRSTPVVAVEAAVLNGFGEVLGEDLVAAVEIGDGAGYFEDAVVRPGAQAHAADGHFEGSLAGVIEGAELAQLGGGGLRRERAFPPGPAPWCLPRNAVQKRAADLAQVALDERAGAATLPGWVGEKSARAGVQTSRLTSITLERRSGLHRLIKLKTD